MPKPYLPPAPASISHPSEHSSTNQVIACNRPSYPSVRSSGLQSSRDLAATTFSDLPHELTRHILSFVTQSRFSTVIVENQFDDRVEIQCGTCTFRSIALVCKLWYDVAREMFHREMVGVLDRRDVAESVVAALGKSEKMAGEVRFVDASLRGRVVGGGRRIVAGDPSVPAAIPIESDIVVQPAQERDRPAGFERDCEILRRVLKLCHGITRFDADFGVYPFLKLPGALPTSLRNLTLRNVEAIDTFTILAGLPNLSELTLRLVLDWYIDDTESHTLPLAACRLTRFELSIVGFGETSLSSMNRLLAGSRDSLRHLTLRNKYAASAAGFVPVARGLIAQYGPQLESLAVQDIPRWGQRSKGDHPREWFPRHVIMPNLRRLHLCGVSYSPVMIKSLRSQRLVSLRIEDFDSTSATPLLDSMRELPALRILAVTHGDIGWDSQHEEIERRCEEIGCELRAGWRLKRIDRRWW